MTDIKELIAQADAALEGCEIKSNGMADLCSFYDPDQLASAAQLVPALRDALAAERARVEEWRSEYQTARNGINTYRDKNIKIIAALEESRAKVEALEAELGEERDESMWRFWSNKAVKLATNNERLREALVHLDGAYDCSDVVNAALNGEPKE